MEHEEEKTRCTNCKCHRVTADFIGKSGNIVKRCLKCREKDAKQKKRPDIIEKRNKRQNEKKILY
jgi:predicted sulfurtransferase